jgi:hypothetical protein
VADLKRFYERRLVHLKKLKARRKPVNT